MTKKADNAPMRYGPLTLEEAEGAILGHNVTGKDGRRLLRKGQPLTPEDLELLRRIGRDRVYVAQLGDGDVDENSAALRVARALAGPGLEIRGPAAGRVNLHAEALGVLRIEGQLLRALNELDGITLATRRQSSAVDPGRIAGTIKILPYALPGSVVAAAEALSRETPILRLDALPRRRAGLIVTGHEGARTKVVAAFEEALRLRLERLGSELERVDFVSLDEETGEECLATALEAQHEAGIELFLLAGETAIQDRHDLTPRAVERAGGTVTCFGAPVDPGNLVLLGSLDNLPILGAPGCARSPKTNIVDLLLPRLLVGDTLTRADLAALADGGLLEDIAERPMPRQRT